MSFHEQTPAPRVARYKEDLKFFQMLRRSVQRRYQEVINYDEYEARSRKLLNQHGGASPSRYSTTAENLATTDWSTSDSPERQYITVRLINRCLRAMLMRHGVRYSQFKECFFFEATPDLMQRKIGNMSVFKPYSSKTTSKMKKRFSSPALESWITIFAVHNRCVLRAACDPTAAHVNWSVSSNPRSALICFKSDFKSLATALSLGIMGRAFPPAALPTARPPWLSAPRGDVRAS